MYVAREWMSVVVNAILGAIIITRLHAMYQRSRKVLILLIVVFLFANIFGGVITAISMKQSKFVIVPVSKVKAEIDNLSTTF
ncbi:hypothetical protein DFH29DRAFT_275373 [Suillus ampliporus]|nr:hypothetical protein DFH29DRAFT_275373 [Suillus ampliporus]